MAAGTSQWFENWFNEDYLALYQHRDMADAEGQISLILSTLGVTPSTRILDLGCGEGRHVEILFQQGFQAKGIDLSPVLIERGKARFPHLNIAVGDMRDISGKFDVILSLFTSFGYFDEDRKNMSVLTAVSKALNPGGFYWLDYLNPDFLKKNLKGESVRILPDGRQVVEKRRIEGDMVVKDIVFESGNSRRVYQERVKLYDKAKLIALLKDAGLNPKGSFGDYDGSRWSPDSPRTIIFSEKYHE